MPKGLVVENVRVGNGPAARRGNMVDVRYRICLRQGELLNEGVQDGLILGTRRAFAGFERGVEGMQVGGVRKLIVPPHLGYDDGRMLVCELELLAIRDYR